MLQDELAAAEGRVVSCVSVFMERLAAACLDAVPSNMSARRKSALIEVILTCRAGWRWLWLLACFRDQSL